MVSIYVIVQGIIGGIVLHSFKSRYLQSMFPKQENAMKRDLIEVCEALKQKLEKFLNSELKAV